MGPAHSDGDKGWVGVWGGGGSGEGLKKKEGEGERNGKES